MRPFAEDSFARCQQCKSRVLLSVCYFSLFQQQKHNTYNTYGILHCKSRILTFLWDQGRPGRIDQQTEHLMISDCHAHVNPQHHNNCTYQRGRFIIQNSIINLQKFYSITAPQLHKEALTPLQLLIRACSSRLAVRFQFVGPREIDLWMARQTLRRRTMRRSVNCRRDKIVLR